MRNFGKKVQYHLLTATSYMIPFVVVGGIFYSMSLMFSGDGIVPTEGWLLKLCQIGQTGLHLFIPVLGGYIAYSMEDKPGLAPGFIGAYLAQEMGEGFLGGILAGFLAGCSIGLLRKIKIPEVYRTVQTVFLFPVAGTLLTAGIMQFIVGPPLAMFMSWMILKLNTLSQMAKIPLGILLGAMVGCDLGGPINKVAYTFAQSQVNTLPFIMGGVGIAGAVPPTGVGLATILFRRKFSETERESGKAAIIMGIMGITEGAIPFVMTDPIRTIMIYMIGSAIGCTFGFMAGCLNHTAWGGLIVLPVVEHRIAYIVGICIGSLVVAVLMGLLKKDYKKSNSSQGNFEEKDDWELIIEDW
ncbi:MAG: PTS fructose transporter subunit IIC [Lachnospiraceae bacterium]